MLTINNKNQLIFVNKLIFNTSIIARINFFFPNFSTSVITNNKQTKLGVETPIYILVELRSQIYAQTKSLEV